MHALWFMSYQLVRVIKKLFKETFKLFMGKGLKNMTKHLNIFFELKKNVGTIKTQFIENVCPYFYQFNFSRTKIIKKISIENSQVNKFLKKATK